MEEELLNVDEEDLGIKNDTDVEEPESVTIVETPVATVEIETPETVVIEMEEVPMAYNSNAITHESLLDRDIGVQHKMSSIENLVSSLEKLSSVKQEYAPNGGFAEFHEWHSDAKARGIGYFVQLVRENKDSGNLLLDVCTDQAGVYGVTVSESGFCGHQSENYDRLGLTDENGDRWNKGDSTAYDQVCLIGCVRVRTIEANIKVGDYVIPGVLGHAIKSENEVGYKVVSVGTTIEFTGSSQNYVGIILTPQNESVNRIAEKITEAQGGVGNLSASLDDLIGKVDGIDKTVISIGGKVDGLQGEMDKNLDNAQDRLDAADEAVKQAKEIAEQANQTMERVTGEYAQTLTDLSVIKESMPKVKSDLAKIQEELEPLASWEGASGEHGTAGFVAQAKKDSTTLASMTEAFGENGSDITAIIQKIDSNGGAIEMIVSHTDKYSLGEKSPTNGFTLAEAEVLNPGHIYVPTVTHFEYSPKYSNVYQSKIQKGQVCYFNVEGKTYGFTALKTFEANTLIEFNVNNNQLLVGDIVHTYNEAVETPKSASIVTLRIEYTFNFQYLDVENEKSCMSYVWGYDQDEMINTWIPNKEVSTTTEYSDGKSDGDLWYLSQPILSGDIVLYSPNILYCWNADKKVWMPVAKADDPKSSTMGAILQTASKLTSTYTDVKGNMSVIQQEVDRIATMVGNSESLSKIEQTADEIRMGVYQPTEGSSSLEILLGGLTSTAVSSEPKLIQSIANSVEAMDGKKYKQAPTWNGIEFVFAGEPSADGIYYFEDGKPKTYFCKDIDGGHEVYAIDNIAISSLNTRVTDTESEVETWTKFKSEFNETMTSITQESSADEASIFSNVFGEYNKREDIVYADEEGFTIGVQDATWCSKPPKWDEKNKKFQFETEAIDKDGEIPKDVYCTLESTLDCYYKLFVNESKVVTSYELYKHITSNYASILQKTDADGSVIGLTVGGTDKDASGVLIKSVNDNTEAHINADKIGINGTAIFRDNMRDGTTTISGNYVKTGVLVSENYDGPVTYIQYGLKIADGKIVKGEDADCIRYSPITSGIQYELLPIGTYYYADEIVVDIELSTFESDGNVFVASNTSYVVSGTDFDLVPQNGSENYITTGTKFDLTEGTIYSKNFSLDRDGDLTISGRITATSGYIGNKDKGFTIDAHNVILTHIVGVDGLLAGDYYFKHDGKYYSFTVDEDLIEGFEITLNCNDLTLTIEDTSVDVVVGKASTTATYLDSELSTGEYYLASNQWGLSGSNANGPGVYISPLGIGLGNGEFYIENTGDVYMHGNIDMGGSITLGGDITFADTGKITWTNKSNPVRVLYHSGAYEVDGEVQFKVPDIPSGKHEYHEDSATYLWHIIYQEDLNTSKGLYPDYYVSYTYDGGTTWTVPIQIRGRDGATGPQGDSGVTEVDVEEMLQKVYGITSTEITDTSIGSPYIYSPNISGGTITGGIFAATGASDDKSAYLIYNQQSLRGSLRFDHDGYTKALQEILKGVEGDGLVEIDGIYYTRAQIQSLINAATDRVFLTTYDGAALKLESSGNMSLSAGILNDYGVGDGTIYFMSKVHFAQPVTGISSVATFG